MSKEDREAQKQLAEAMNNLAAAIKRFQDPVWLQKVLGDAFQGLAGVETLRPTIAQALPAGVSIEAITVRLTDEQREELSSKIYEALQPQFESFNLFVKDSLKELPAHRLAELAERVKRGEKPKIQRRRGCVFIETDGGYEAYLGL